MYLSGWNFVTGFTATADGITDIFAFFGALCLAVVVVHTEGMLAATLADGEDATELTALGVTTDDDAAGSIRARDDWRRVSGVHCEA